ncbi:hypothetical protein M8C21_025912, partial [Ambrosia artemisiifolia]
YLIASFTNLAKLPLSLCQFTLPFSALQSHRLTCQSQPPPPWQPPSDTMVNPRRQRVLTELWLVAVATGSVSQLMTMAWQGVLYCTGHTLFKNTGRLDKSFEVIHNDYYYRMILMGEQIIGLKEMFKEMDTDNNETIIIKYKHAPSTPGDLIAFKKGGEAEILMSIPFATLLHFTNQEIDLRAILMIMKNSRLNIHATSQRTSDSM